MRRGNKIIYPTEPNNDASFLGMRVKKNSSVPYSAVLQKYWLSVLLLVLTAASFFSVYAALLTVFIFTFLVPGLLLSRFFRFETYEVWAFVPVLSVLISTQLVYYMSLLFGYSRETILFSFLALTAVCTLVSYKKGETFPLKNFPKIKKISKATVIFFSLIFLISLIVLLRSVWFENQYGIVITGSNWQDTPMHYEIVESLNNGNFPPQIPYYSGTKMTYHYFVDFHTAILEKVYGFLPKLLPFLDAVLILVFALSIYALARPSGKRASIFSVVIAAFGWGFSYFGLLSALNFGQFSASQNYIYQYGQLFGLPPVFDNLLQQRPLLIGLPVFAVVLALLRNMEDKRRVILAGIIVGLVFQFHVVSFFACYVAFFVAILLNLKHFKLSYLYFLLPSVLALPFIFSGGISATTIALSAAFPTTFVQGNPVAYYVLNLGIPFLIAWVSLVKKGNYLLKGTFIILFLIPNLMLLTPNVWDMYKFFIFAWIPIAVLSGTFLAKTRKSLALLLILLSVLASVSVVIYNVGTNFSAASRDEYDLGMWVRNNTPERSVFLTYYSIHSPPTMIGGRERVLSYVNWPYGQGVPFSDIMKREHDIDRAYNGSETDLKEVVATYQVGYVYVGSEEQRNYPGCADRFNEISWLKTVYAVGSLHIYRVDLPQNG